MAPTRRLDGIQWLRALAAGLVVVEHTKNAISTGYLGLAPAQSPLSVFPFSAGVDLFFVISGFIMAYSSGGLFDRPGGWRVFLLRRLARIVPLYWLTTALMLAIFVATGSRAWSDASWPSVIASFLFLPSANAAGEPFPLFVIGWTLNYEMAFYAVFALFIGLRQTAALLSVAATIVLVVLCGLMVEPQALPLRFWSNPIVLEFVGGIGLYGLYQARWLRLGAGVRLGLAAAALAVLALQPADPGLWRALAWGLPALALVAAALPGQAAATPAGRRSFADLAGDLSYGVYLVHLPIVLAGATALRVLAPTQALAWFGLFPALVAVGSIAAAALLHVLIERPILSAARRTTTPIAPARDAVRTPLPSSATAASPN